MMLVIVGENFDYHNHLQRRLKLLASRENNSPAGLAALGVFDQIVVFVSPLLGPALISR
jgi:hypothetical protein